MNDDILNKAHGQDGGGDEGDDHSVASTSSSLSSDAGILAYLSPKNKKGIFDGVNFDDDDDVVGVEEVGGKKKMEKEKEEGNDRKDNMTEINSDDGDADGSRNRQEQKTGRESLLGCSSPSSNVNDDEKNDEKTSHAKLEEGGAILPSQASRSVAAASALIPLFVAPSSSKEHVKIRNALEEALFYHFPADDFCVGSPGSDASSSPSSSGASEDVSVRATSLVRSILEGEYESILRDSDVGRTLVSPYDLHGCGRRDGGGGGLQTALCRSVQRYVLSGCVEETEYRAVECLAFAVACLNLFYQWNYTGPIGDDDDPWMAALEKYMHATWWPKEDGGDGDSGTGHFVISNALAVDGELPSPVARGIGLLFVARCVLRTLTYGALPPCEDDHGETSKSCLWTVPYHVEGDDDDGNKDGELTLRSVLPTVCLWNARASLAHQRLLGTLPPSAVLWEDVSGSYYRILSKWEKKKKGAVAARLRLEYGLAQYHFDRKGMGREDYQTAAEAIGLEVMVTGRMGKRTKFQQESKAQMVVLASRKEGTDIDYKNVNINDDEDHNNEPNNTKEQDSVCIDHAEDTILHEHVALDDPSDPSTTCILPILDRTVLLALCLDVKARSPVSPDNPLSFGEMSAYLSRVVAMSSSAQCWTVFSTALLERAWIESDGVHTRERSLLQLQALVDQHTTKLTLTQSTKESAGGDGSAKVEDRVRHLHLIVYPPRWELRSDFATRLAKVGMVTSAAEIYAGLEDWDNAVDCYTRAGRVEQAEKLIRERLQEKETARMYTALGDITGKIEYYHKAIEISGGKFARAHEALGRKHFAENRLLEAADSLHAAVKVRPLTPSVWFLLGTIAMRLERWQVALEAFSEVVQQEPEMGDAWANVAAVHMRNRDPERAYPCLAESLRRNRNVWRVWQGKLYTCIDLGKYDEAMQSTHELMNLAAKTGVSKGATGEVEKVERYEVEEKCIRAIVRGVLDGADVAAAIAGEGPSRDQIAAADSATRSVQRLDALLSEIQRNAKLADDGKGAWIWDVRATFSARIGRTDLILDNLMVEYRAILNVRGWETDEIQRAKVCRVVGQIVNLQCADGMYKASWTKAKYMVRSVANRIRSKYISAEGKIPQDLMDMDLKLCEVEEGIERKFNVN
uniref:Uncharacterized protein n=1 Tax=Corethron hystrix TaxID=216773 RepID=A0A7S1B592_9STRA|mmetsp:Transcript_12871/g.28413  ORF Transcript_12871/g.28413 Transcript_12871/m.28413 type:complete len:1140 (+) Transcript_12871:204-3623(+)